MTSIRTHYKDRHDFLKSLEDNPGMIFIKFGAEWCGPCKLIENYVHQRFSNMPPNVQTVIIDVDENFDVYAYLKNKKIVKTIPSILCYQKGNTHFAPDDVISDSNEDNVKQFLDNCLENLD